MQRTTLNDFQEAMEAIDNLLGKYAYKDEGVRPKWETQDVYSQRMHAQGHLDIVTQMLRSMPMEAFNFEEFVSLACRGLMLLQQAILKYPNEALNWKANTLAIEIKSEAPLGD